MNWLRGRQDFYLFEYLSVKRLKQLLVSHMDTHFQFDKMAKQSPAVYLHMLNQIDISFVVAKSESSTFQKIPLEDFHVPKDYNVHMELNKPALPSKPTVDQLQPEDKTPCSLLESL